MNRSETVERSRAVRILYGELQGKRADYVENRERRFAYAFLLLTELVVGRVIPIDEAHLDTVEDELEYLKNTENVHACRFEPEYNWHKNESAPFLGFLGEERVPVVLQYQHGAWFMLSTDDTPERKVDDLLASQIADDAVSIIPKAPEDVHSGRQLILRAARASGREYGGLLILMLLGTAVSSVIPSAVGVITGRMIPNGETSGIYVLTLSLFLGVVAGLLINIAVNRTKIRIQTRAGHFTLSAVLGRIMDMKAEDERKLSGRIIALVMMFVGAVDSVISSSAAALVFLAQGLMVLRTMWPIDTRISVVVLLLAIGEVCIAAVMEAIIYKKTLAERDASAKLSTIRREILDNMETIRNSAMEEKIFYRFSVAYDEKMRLHQKNVGITQTISIVGSMISGIGLFFIYLHVARIRLADAGSVSAMITSFTLMVSFLNSMTLSFGEVVSALPQLKFADAVLQYTPEESASNTLDRKISGGLEMDHVTFSYGADLNPVIRDVSLTIRPGEYVGIVGSSGCGKSTLMKLMLGFLTATEGHISYDGIDISQYNLKALRRQFGVVLQNAQVLTGTVRRNIGLSEEADIELVREAAASAAVLEDIESMPMKFNTMLSGEAEVISGGQRQRIVLARALMRKPRILFLDEATSAVDNIAQKAIRENLDKLGITRIAIAHRLSTVVNCDRILVLDHGEIVEQGSYNELMEQNGLFAKMARRNML